MDTWAASIPWLLCIRPQREGVVLTSLRYNSSHRVGHAMSINGLAPSKPSVNVNKSQFSSLPPPPIMNVFTFLLTFLYRWLPASGRESTRSVGRTLGVFATRSPLPRDPSFSRWLEVSVRRGKIVRFYRLGLHLTPSDRNVDGQWLESPR